VRGTDHAIWRRIHLIPFDLTIPAERRDPQLLEKLAAERDGILRWAVDGCLAWQREGLTPPAAVTAATDEYREDSHPLRDWLDECCVIDPTASTPFSELRDSYVEWTIRERINQPLRPGRFIAALTEAGYVRETGTNNVKLRRGLRLVKEGPDV
jgi:putative DNA primase/helicase